MTSMMFEPLRKYAEFEGRARRSEYWLFTLFQVLVGFGLFVVMAMVGGFADLNSGGGGVLAGVIFLVFAICAIFGLAMFIPSLAVSIRRLHDSDKSGAWLLLSFVPLGGVVVFIFTLLDGTPGPNRFGPDPKGREGDGASPVTPAHHHPVGIA
jgi:uncharacterized membrane protein YhaH (DUF805 family)